MVPKVKISLTATILLFSIVNIHQLIAAVDSDTPYQNKVIEFNQSVVPDSKNYQKNWKRMTGFEYSGLHWDQFVVVYTNKGDAIYKHNFLEYSAWFDDPDDEDNEPTYKTYPEGTTFLKENYKITDGKPSEFESATVMIKRYAGFDPDGGDWEYMQFDNSGKMLLRGNASKKHINTTCANCHKNVNERDFIFSNIFSGSSK